MIQAFRGLGYEVAVVTGLESERAGRIAAIKDTIRQGRQYDFVYSESSTLPTLLTESGRGLAWRPNLDFEFLTYMRQRHIPVGLFYRDVYWRTDHYRRMMTTSRRMIYTLFYHYDWLRYRRIVNHLYLPSLAMAAHLPTHWPADRVSALPPGAGISAASAGQERDYFDGDLSLLYVGGVAPPFYDLTPTFAAIRSMQQVCITICCRSEEWNRWRAHYEPIPIERVRIVHVQGEDLSRLYDEANAFLLMRSDDPYLEFAMPVKVFEALGHGLPIITNQGTQVAKLVTEEEIGWVVSSVDDLQNLLVSLSANPDGLKRKRYEAERARERHTWTSRAKHVVTTLAQSSNE